jgi:phospholipid transport system transporter-binding protein
VSAAAPGEVLPLEGSLTFDTIPAVLLETAQFVARPDLPERLTIDFTKVEGVDSAAVALILEWRRMAVKLGKSVAFVNLPPNLLALAQLYGVTELLQPGA